MDNADKGRDKGDIVPAGLIAEDTSHKSVAALFRTLPDGDLASAGAIQHLPVKEPPEIPWGDPTSDWANIVKFGADPTGKADASAALQAAIDSGAKTVYLPAGMQFQFNGTVEIRGPVERIIGLEGNFHTDGRAVWTAGGWETSRGLPERRRSSSSAAATAAAGRACRSATSRRGRWW